MKKLQQHKGPSLLRVAGFFGIGVVMGVTVLVGVARLSWHNKFYPGLSIAGIRVGGLTQDEARAKLSEATANYQPRLVYSSTSWTAPKDLVKYEIETTLNEAYSYGRRFMIGDYLLLLLNKQSEFPLVLSEGRTESLELLIADIATVVEIPPVDPDIKVSGRAVLVVQGSDGVVIGQAELSENIARNYRELSSREIEVPVKIVEKRLDEDKLDQIKQRAQKLVESSLTLSVEDEKVVLKGEELVALLSTDGESILNERAITEYVAGLGESLKTEPQDARFEFVEGVVKEFAPGKDGLEVDVQLTTNSLQQGIIELLESETRSKAGEIVVKRTPPQVTTEKVNQLGIKERIGRGESYYAHSIPNRIYNVGLAAERTNTALIAPGEEYSFNKSVGEISGATGYRTAYVISGGRTVLGDGGGVCQVSTTVFRAALAAGLPITERWAHAYRVGYYEQNSKAGVDATIYSPSKDLKFLNDTPGHILVQTINDPKKQYLVVEIYGTSDGRIATVSEPKVWGVTPPPPDIYQDDPSLPTGTVKQVDWSAWGAKASFDYKVVRGEEVLQEKTFSSAYRPWANVYLRGTGQ